MKKIEMGSFLLYAKVRVADTRFQNFAVVILQWIKVDSTIMVSKKCQIVGKQVMVIF